MLCTSIFLPSKLYENSYWQLSSQVIYKVYCISDFKIEDFAKFVLSCGGTTDIILIMWYVIRVCPSGQLIPWLLLLVTWSSITPPRWGAAGGRGMETWSLTTGNSPCHPDNPTLSQTEHIDYHFTRIKSNLAHFDVHVLRDILIWPKHWQVDLWSIAGSRCF